MGLPYTRRPGKLPSLKKRKVSLVCAMSELKQEARKAQAQLQAISFD